MVAPARGGRYRLGVGVVVGVDAGVGVRAGFRAGVVPPVGGEVEGTVGGRSGRGVRVPLPESRRSRTGGRRGGVRRGVGVVVPRRGVRRGAGAHGRGGRLPCPGPPGAARAARLPLPGCRPGTVRAAWLPVPGRRPGTVRTARPPDPGHRLGVGRGVRAPRTGPAGGGPAVTGPACGAVGRVVGALVARPGTRVPRQADTRTRPGGPGIRPPGLVLSPSATGRPGRCRDGRVVAGTGRTRSGPGGCERVPSRLITGAAGAAGHGGTPGRGVPRRCGGLRAYGVPAGRVGPVRAAGPAEYRTAGVAEGLAGLRPGAAFGAAAGGLPSCTGVLAGHLSGVLSAAVTWTV